jgi:hypothetical protein
LARQALYARQFEEEKTSWLRELRAEAFVQIKGEKSKGQNLNVATYYVTSGEPAGIGVDLCIANCPIRAKHDSVCGMADPTLLLQRAHRLGLPLEIHYYEAW